MAENNKSHLDTAPGLPPKSGWMTKRGNGFFSSWKRRVFQLGTDGILRYYVHPNAITQILPKAKGMLDLNTCRIIRRGAACQWKLSSAPKEANVENMLELVLPNRTYAMFCDTAEDADNWLVCLEAARVEKNAVSVKPPNLKVMQYNDAEISKGGANGSESKPATAETSIKMSVNTCAPKLSAALPPVGGRFEFTKLCYPEHLDRHIYDEFVPFKDKGTIAKCNYTQYANGGAIVNASTGETVSDPDILAFEHSCAEAAIAEDLAAGSTNEPCTNISCAGCAFCDFADKRNRYLRLCYIYGYFYV